MCSRMIGAQREQRKITCIGEMTKLLSLFYQVSVSFEDDERKPGEKTNLILKASPGSRVAFVAVDKSVQLLKAGNELTKEKVCTSFQMCFIQFCHAEENNQIAVLTLIWPCNVNMAV